MTFKVHLVAFTDNIREVDITTPSPDETHQDTLSRIFVYGQNDLQPQNMPSVSAGDVIEYKGYWLISPVGYKELSPEQFNEYKNMNREQRLAFTWTR